MIAWTTVVGLAPGLVSKKSAATPATCGDAIDVPEIVFVAVSLLDHADVMLEPGAKISTQVPKFENEDRESLLVVEPTVRAFVTRLGDELHASALLFPAATA